MFASYGAEKVNYGGEGLVSQINCDVLTCARSAVGLTFDRDTRIGMPFPTDGGHQTFGAQFNGWLGGAKYNRYTTEVRHHATLWQFGGGALGTDPVTLTLSAALRGGMVFGDPGGF